MTFNPLVLVDCRYYLDGADLTGFSNKVELQAKANDLDSTTFQNTTSVWHTRVGGLFDGSVNSEGFYQAGDLTMPDDQLWASLGVGTTAVTAIPTDGSVGTLAYLTKALQCDYQFGAKVGDLLSWTAQANSNSPLVRGKVMHPQGTARTATGSGTGIQLGAVSASQRIYANLHVLGFTDGSMTVKLQSSVDNTFGSPTDRVTFSAVTGLGGQASSLLGAVTDAWWRVVWTITGGSVHSFLFAVSAGIGPK
jgi:hypothetical protein